MSNLSPELLSIEIRKACLKMTNKANSSHIGSMFSCIDLISVLYTKILNIDPLDPENPSRDFFLQSKGHAGAALYAALSKLNFFDEKLLQTYYQNGSKLGGHISHKEIPGVEISTGSLGHALSIGAGISLELKNKKRDNKVFVLLSDGELDEGSNWEAILFSNHHKLKNLTIIIDYNKLQSIRSISETLELEPLDKKFLSFGWEVSTIDGHNFIEIEKALAKVNNKPHVIIANTIKGKGVSFMENSVLWHYRSAQNDEYKMALREIENSVKSREDN